MKITPESLQAHDYHKKITALTQKSAELKKKSEEINAQMDATRKQCDRLLHPEKDSRK
jgi:uncharacterized coiled-coil DUF342 family protein